MLHKFVSFIKIVYDILGYKYDCQFRTETYTEVYSLRFNSDFELLVVADIRTDYDRGEHTYGEVRLYFVSTDGEIRLMPPDIVEPYYMPINKIFHEYKTGFMLDNCIHSTATKLIDELMGYSPEELKLYINMLCGI